LPAELRDYTNDNYVHGLMEAIHAADFMVVLTR
jgi:hypothetical protein